MLGIDLSEHTGEGVRSTVYSKMASQFRIRSKLLSPRGLEEGPQPWSVPPKHQQLLAAQG